jgi:putative membrane protein
MSHNKTAVISLLIASALAIPALGQAQTPAPVAAGSAQMTLSKADQKAVVDMAIANMAEVNAGKMAVAKSQNPQVKAYAQKMIDEHTTALNDVTALAQAKGVTMPTDVDATHKAMAAKLDKLSGDAFDKAYMKDAGVSDHTKVHNNLAKVVSKAKDPDVKAAATKMMPVVDQHLQLAKDQTSGKGGTAK